MNRVACTLSLLAWLVTTPATGFGLSAVFNGDPINPATGLPYELAPGVPLIEPGPDGILGTADDTISPAIVGDVDLVVRSGSIAATAVLPPPAVASGRSTLPVGIAGSRAGGGTEVPFTVFLSDGAASAGAPVGHLLAAPDMDNIPVIVVAFADLDGDGFIGPTNADRAGAADNGIEVRELEPVGRAVALFSGGVARGSIAVRGGLPASHGGLSIALTAMALTGPFDPVFLGGSVPSGPAISTALPFLPERDLSKLIRDRAVPVGPGTTLQEVVRFAVLPMPGQAVSFALPLDGSSPTIDVAVVDSQPAVRAAFRSDTNGLAQQSSVGDLVVGTTAPARWRRLRLVPVDRWGNPADPGPDFIISVNPTAPLRVDWPPRARAGRQVRLTSAAGIRLMLRVPRGTGAGTSGVLTAERDGVAIDALAYRVDPRVNQPRADLVVPSRTTPTIQAAINAVHDTNHDGAMVIDVRPGLYRENVVLNRAVELRGAGEADTVIAGTAAASAVTLSAPNAIVRDLTVIGGANGFALNAAAQVIDSRAWRNRGVGIAVNSANAVVWRSDATDNESHGVQVQAAAGVACSEGLFLDNLGAGVVLSSATGVQVDNNLIADNAVGGLTLSAVSGAAVSDNQIANNLGGPQNAEGELTGPGIAILNSQTNQVIGNLSANNDADGLHVDQTAGNLVSANVFDSNKGVGMFVRRSADDFDAAPGVQAAPGDNTATNNRKGDVQIRTH